MPQNPVAIKACNTATREINRVDVGLFAINWRIGVDGTKTCKGDVLRRLGLSGRQLNVLSSFFLSYFLKLASEAVAPSLALIADWRD